MDENSLKSLEQIKEMLAQEYTISKHSVLANAVIKDRFIYAVRQHNDLGKFEEIIKSIMKINEEIRREGFLHIADLKDEIQNKIYHNIAELLAASTNLMRITALLESSFYYLPVDELIESVLIHDGLIMCVLGHTNNEISIRLHSMINML